MRRRRTGLIIASLALLIMAARHPSADLRILTHDRTDRAPQSFQAAIDFGLVAISVLVTWTAKRIA
ncbi:MAG: hypothetical protein V4610_01225 [Pseudomonadota bacterium]|jgi:hypothetical protein|uniref:Uncharacterized protein n=1 Tax=hydrothermal vent metagenome TaxID=652676 RepID=A0A170PPS9_9ZZZZ